MSLYTTRTSHKQNSLNQGKQPKSGICKRSSCRYLFYRLFVVFKVVHLSLRAFAELLKDLFPPGSCLGWTDGQTHGLD